MGCRLPAERPGVCAISFVLDWLSRTTAATVDLGADGVRDGRTGLGDEGTGLGEAGGSITIGVSSSSPATRFVLAASAVSLRVPFFIRLTFCDTGCWIEVSVPCHN